MRVIAGAHKGRRLLAGRGDALRPTSGRVKEALFSILGDRVAGARMLDLFSGTGAIGIEALSRGAAQVTFVESGADSLKLLKENLHRCGAEAGARIERLSAASYLRRGTDAPYDLVFADPPYKTDSARDVLPDIDRSAMISPQTLVILEHPTRQDVPPRVGRLAQTRQYRYGDTTLTLFAVDDVREPAP